MKVHIKIKIKGKEQDKTKNLMTSLSNEESTNDEV